jgi:hypothetical protein
VVAILMFLTAPLAVPDKFARHSENQNCRSSTKGSEPKPKHWQRLATELQGGFWS